MAPKSNKSLVTKPEAVRPVDVYIEKYSELYKSPNSKLMLWFSTPLILIGVLGLVWSIPFPYLKFLGQYNGYFNWASFLVAFSIYYYYKLSPVLSYLMLLVLFALSYAVIDLQRWQNTGGPALWIIRTVTLVVGLAGQYVTAKSEARTISFTDSLQFILIGPIWLLHFLVKKFSMRY